MPHALDPALDRALESLAREEPAVEVATRRVPLRAPTAETWTRCALGQLDALLDDHAACELKAASNALALLGRHPNADRLVQRMTGLAREEMGHYRLVRSLLQARDARLSRPRRNPYVKGLHEHRLGREHALLDDLLICALVEARSCERFTALARGMRAGWAGDEPAADRLAELYDRLAKSESGHAWMFVELARDHFDAALVEEQLDLRCGLEAELLARLPVGPRMHGGHA